MSAGIEQAETPASPAAGAAAGRRRGGHRAATPDQGPGPEVRAVVAAGLDALVRAGRLPATGVTDALEGAGRALARRVVRGAATDHPAMVEQRSLAAALAEGPTLPALGTATGAALALRFARRFRRLGFLARRTPAFVAMATVPALVASVSRGAHELGMVAAHLDQRARRQGVEPDVERVRRAAVQLVCRQPVDPEVEPSHGALAFVWLRRAVRAALPFTAGVATADPTGLAAAAAGVDVARLGAT